MIVVSDKPGAPAPNAPVWETPLQNAPPPPQITFLGYVSDDGGDAVQVFELARTLGERGSLVTLLVPDLPLLRHKATAYAGVPGLRVVLTPLIRYDTFKQNPLDVLRLIWPLRNVPLLHIYCGDICPPRLTLFMVDLLRPPRVFATIQAAKPDMAVGGKRAAYWAACARRRFQSVICPSLQGQQIQTKYGLPKEKTTVIYNGVDTKRYASGNANVARAALGLSPDTPLLLFMARLHRQKRPLDALDAFARAADILPDLHFALIGNGPMEAEARAYAATLPCAARVHFADFAENVPDYLAACDAWILPSEAENFSLGLIESLSAGCAVVATACPGSDEVLINEENALTAPVGDVEALGAAIVRVFSDAPLRARLKTNAQKTAARFRLEALSDQHQRAYAPGAAKEAA